MLDRLSKLAVHVLCVNRMTVAYGEWLPGQGLKDSNTHWHQTHQVEHGPMQVFQCTEKNEQYKCGLYEAKPKSMLNIISKCRGESYSLFTDKHRFDPVFLSLS